MKTQENRFIFKHSPDKPSFEKQKAQPVVEDFIRERQGAGPGAEILVAQSKPETQKEIPLLTHLRSGYESLTKEAFLVGVKPKWETIATKLTPEVLSKVSKLEKPRIYGVNAEGQLLIGDGGKVVPAFTLGNDYFKARNAAKSAGLNLMTRAEYEGFQVGRIGWTWLESGEAPKLALGGFLDHMYEYDPKRGNDRRGARRVLRVSGF